MARLVCARTKRNHKMDMKTRISLRKDFTESAHVTAVVKLKTDFLM
jgi:hypothetical protein